MCISAKARHHRAYKNLLQMSVLAIMILASCNSSELPETDDIGRVNDIATEDLVDSPNEPMNPIHTVLPSPATSTATPSPSTLPTSAPIATPVLPPKATTEDFLFGIPNSDCELPCWQGLTVDESEASDLASTFEDAFESEWGGGISPPALGDSLDSDNSTLYKTGMSWTVEVNPYREYRAEVWTDLDSQLIEGMHLVTTLEETNLWFTPQTVIRRLGEPTNLVAQWASDDFGWRYLDLAIIYDEGLIFVFNYLYFPPELMSSQSGTTSSVSEILCLDGPAWSGKYDRGSRELFITRPFRDNSNEHLDPIQDYILNDLLVDRGIQEDIEILFDTSLETIAALALQAESVCLTPAT